MTTKRVRKPVTFRVGKHLMMDCYVLGDGKRCVAVLCGHPTGITSRQATRLAKWLARAAAWIADGKDRE